MRSVIRAAVVSIVMVCTTPVAAETAGDGEDAFFRADFATALRIWRPLAEQGLVGIQNNIGVIFARGGEGIPQDYVEAAKWFSLAADRGVGPAMVNLGFLYYSGQGLPKDYVEAYKWFSLAVPLKAANAEQGRDEAAKKMTPAQIAEAQKRAREWKPMKPMKPMKP